MCQAIWIFQVIFCYELSAERPAEMGVQLQMVQLKVQCTNLSFPFYPCFETSSKTMSVKAFVCKVYWSRTSDLRLVPSRSD